MKLNGYIQPDWMTARDSKYDLIQYGAEWVDYINVKYLGTHLPSHYRSMHSAHASDDRCVNRIYALH